MERYRIHPQVINGIWDKGYVLDVHTINSEYLGDDDFGHPRFRNTRSELGELLYQLKYKSKYNCITEIMDLITPFLDEWQDLRTVSSVIPVPPSNKYRNIQPTDELAEAIANYLGIYYVQVLDKLDSLEAKNADGTPQVAGCIRAKVTAKYSCNVLIIDDLYRTGTTMSECVNVLRQDHNINKIYVLAITRAKPKKL